MATSLDRALNAYRAQPKDQSGVRNTKMSLIFDARTAAFTDTDTFYQIGYQGFTELLGQEKKLAHFEKTVFDYSNSKIDPLYLASEEKEQLLDEISMLLFVLSDHCMNLATVKILEYLIQVFSINRLKPEYLLLVVLPYLETSLFVRVVRTIPFKSLPKDQKFLRPFSVIQESRQPIDRKQLVQWIIQRPALLEWIIGNVPNICCYHPNGVFAKFVGVLLSDLMLQTTNDVIISNVFNGAKQAIESPNGYMAPQFLMAISTLIEKQQNVSQELLTKLTKAISKNAETFFESNSFEELFAATVFLFQKSQPINVKAEFVIKIASKISQVKDLIKKVDTSVIARSCANLIVGKTKNEEVVKSAIAMLETPFFEAVAHDFLLGILQNYAGGEYVDMLIQKIANDYPEVLTEDVNEGLKENKVTLHLESHTRQSLIDQLSESSKAAALFSSEIDYKEASAQAVQSLSAAEAADSTDVIEPLLKYFKDRAPESVKEYICEHLFISGSRFSEGLNSGLAKYGKDICPFLEGLPSNNKDILNFLISKIKELPEFNSLPLAAAHALVEKSKESVNTLLRFLPHKQLDFAKVAEGEKEIYQNDLEFVANSAESQAAFILATVHKIVDENDLSPESIILLFSFPDFRSILYIVSKLVSRNQLSAITEAFAISNATTEHIARVNILILINVIIPNINAFTALPTLFTALLDSSLIKQAKDVIKAVPLKDAAVREVLPYIIKQFQLFNGDDKSTKDVFKVSCQNQKSRAFYDQCWANIETAAVALSFYTLTEDKGVIDVIKKYVNDAHVVDLFTAVIKNNQDNENLKLWALDTLNSGLIRAAIPYLKGDMIAKVIPFVCSYPQFYSNAFSFYVKDHEFPAKELEKQLIKDSSSKIKEDKSELPPEVFKNANFTGLLKSLASRNIITPSTVLLESLNAKNDAATVIDVVPTLFKLLKSKDSEKSLPLIFPLLLLCIKIPKDAAAESLQKKSKNALEFMVDNFETIVTAVSTTTVPHIHATALSLIEELARANPEKVAKHATSIFTNLSAETLYNDDMANLQRIKQLLSSVLPILSKANTIDSLLNFISENIDKFSMDRASQILLHSIACLGSDSYKVFQSLLAHEQVDFSLILADQMHPEALMAAVTRLADLCEMTEQLIKFIKQLQLPALPAPVIRFLMVLQKKISEEDFGSFIEETCKAWSLKDFLNFAETAISKAPLTKITQGLICERVDSEPSELYSQLLPALQSLIEHRSKAEELKETTATLTKIIPILELDQAPTITNIIKLTIKSVTSPLLNTVNKEDNSQKILSRQQALTLFASAFDRFKLSILEVFPIVLDYAADFLKIVVENQIEVLIHPTIGSICLIISTSPDFTADKLKDILPLMISPMILEDDKLRELTMKTLSDLCQTLTLEQNLPGFVSALDAKKKPHPLTLICAFDLLKVSLKVTDFHMVRRLQTTLIKIFFLAFSKRFQDWDDTVMFQDTVKDAFVEFANRLNEQIFAIAFSNVLQYMLQLADKAQEDYVIGRVFFVKIILGIVESLKEVFAKYYSSFFDSFVQYTLEANDGSIAEREITINAMKVFFIITQYAEPTFFENRFSKLLDAIKAHFAFFEGEKTAETSEELEQSFEFKIQNYVAPAFAGLMTAAKSNATVMMNVLNDFMKDDNPIVRMGIFATIGVIFDNARDVFLSNYNVILPVLNEQLESSNQEITREASATLAKLRQDITIERYFNENQ